MKDLKIFPKIFIRTFLALGSIIFIVHLSVFFIFPRSYLQSKREELSQKADEMITSLRAKKIDEIKEALDFYSKNSEINVYVKEDSLDGSIPIDPKNHVNLESDSNSLIIEERQIALDDGEKRTVQFIFTTDVKKEAKELSFGFLPYSLFFSFLLSIGVALIYARAIKHQIEEIKDVTDQMMVLDQDAKLLIDTNDEVGELKGQINDLYQTLLETIDDVNLKNREILRLEELKVDFFRGASHELKTPLASLKIILENMKYEIGKYKDRDTYIGRCILIVDELSRHIAQILTASSMDRLKNDEQWLQVDDVLCEIIEQYTLLASERNIRMRKTLSDETLYIGKTALKMILSNILSNAVKYTDRGGQIDIGTKAGWLFIENTFREKEKVDLTKFFESTYDLKKENSNGLGLYITKSLLQNYNVDYKVEKTDCGLAFWIRLSEENSREKE